MSGDKGCRGPAAARLVSGGRRVGGGGGGKGSHRACQVREVAGGGACVSKQRVTGDVQQPEARDAGASG
eukprot:CAMPEP_0173386100 /NCGR_PEP_ID=MMETSP1356-20130122/8699_1 /TAXON_ID=77927 ORGANISM="Hemiselmis virescens, Strain PCC157" /NCGR_SAMPLE_ID=MMETSP1356 /ASSEMBLY_ACC=CAM_ASM_000847 /LENGTH=68 /DNA_ID=CAMNT_0014342195 /DNA_START=182 /DNA_END=385 /DNA_ORIENTATION=-